MLIFPKVWRSPAFRAQFVDFCAKAVHPAFARPCPAFAPQTDDAMAEVGDEGDDINVQEADDGEARGFLSGNRRLAADADAVADTTGEVEAATRIAARQRGRQGRRAAQARAGPSMYTPRDDAPDTVGEATAATRIAARQRGRQGRRAAQARSTVVQGDDEAAAATKVQATLRGRNARARMAQRRRSPSPPPGASVEGDEAPSPLPSHFAKAVDASPTHAAHSGVSAARSLAHGGSVAGSASHSLTEGGGALGGDDVRVGGYCSEVEYESSIAKIKQFKKDAEARKKREEEQRRVQQEAYHRELEIEEARAREVRERREAEAKAARDEQRHRFAKEREFRAAKQQELRQIEESEKSRRVKYLFEVRDEEAKEHAAREEAVRREKLKANRDKYKPVEFLSGAVELPQSAYEQLPAGKEAHRLVRHSKTVAVSELPPVTPRYRGPAREKAEQELRAQRGGKEHIRNEAAERRRRALDFAKESAKEHVNATAPRLVKKVPPPVLTTPKAQAVSSGAGARRGGRGAKPTPRQLELGRMRGRAATDALQGLGGTSVTKDITERSAALTKQVRKRESQLNREVEERVGGLGTDPGQWDVDALLSARADLSAVYINAIKSQVELLEEISDARDQAVDAPDASSPGVADAAVDQGQEVAA